MAVRDVLLIGALLFTIALGVFIVNFTANTMIDKITLIPAFNESQPAVDALEGAQSKINAGFDYIGFGLFIGLVLSLMIVSWFVAGNPIFTFIYILIGIIGVALSTILADTWQQVTQMSVFGTTIANFPITNHLLNWLPLYVAITAFLGVVVMFAKPAE